MEIAKFLNIDKAQKTSKQFFDFQFWGRIPYVEALKRQMALSEKRKNNEIQDTLIFCEHDPVITRGRGSQKVPSLNNFEPVNELSWKNQKVPVIDVQRGGLETLHAPGQLVVYPIVFVNPSRRLQEAPLHPLGWGVHGLMRGLEEVISSWLIESFGLEAFAQSGKTGVWIKPRNSSSLEALKIASLGVAVQRWVSFHGASINLKMDSGIWSLIQPCGFGAEVMTDLWSQTGVSLSVEEAANQLVNKFQLLSAKV